jgi:L-rhamnose isomerase/sugar isomerase
MHEVVKAAALYEGQAAEITATGAAARASTAAARASTAAAPAGGPGIAFMLDQCHNIEPKIPAQIRSVMNVQEAVAKALLVDGEALRAAQLAGDVLESNAVLMDAYNTDVRPLLAELREEMGLAPEPVKAYLASGYGEKIVAERVGGSAAGWGA